MPTASIEEITAVTAGHTAPGRFLDVVRRHPNAPALRAQRGGVPGAWEMWTYAAYADRVAAAAAGLRATGLQPGERVMLMMRNRPDFHWLDLAAQFVRVTPVSIYNSSSADEVQFLVDHAEARVAIVEDEGFLRALLAVRDRLPHLEHVFVLDPPAAGLPPGVLPAAELFTHGRLDLAELVTEVDPTDIATLIYTSGTTGPPKGVMISQANVVYTVEQLRRCVDLAEPLGMRLVSYLPMAHIAERMTSHYQAMILGYDVYCCPDLAQLAAYLREVHPQIVFGVPRVWEKLRSGVEAALAAAPERRANFDQAVAEALAVKAAERAGTATDHQRALWTQLDRMVFAGVREQLGLDAVQVAITGAAPIAPSMLDWFEAVGVPLSEIYGMSESSGPMTWDPHRSKPGFVGRAIPGCEVRIAADGEVCCRGGNVFQGYFKQPDRTAETLIDEWLHSGDLGILDHEGYLRIIDRKKELIITSGGKNISPANLEAALVTVPLVGNACAVGDGRKYVTALLALDPEATAAWAHRNGREASSLAELAQDPDLVREVARGVAQVNRQFAQAERVKTFTIVGEEWLPGSDVLTPTSKLKRRGIQARYAADIDAMYAGADDWAAPAAPAAGVAAVVGSAIAERESATAGDREAHDVGAGDLHTGDLQATDLEFDDAVDYEEEAPDTWRPPSPLWRWWWIVPAAIAAAALGWVVSKMLTSDDVTSRSADTVAASTIAPATTGAGTTIVATVPPTTAAPTSAAPTSAAPSTVQEPNDLLFALGQADELGTFRDAVVTAGLDDDLQAEGPITLFVPTDEAWAKLPPEQLAALLADEGALTKVLEHHVVDGSIYVEDLVDGPLFMRDGSSIEVVAVEDLTFDTTARIVESDDTTINGVLHTIDTVLIPPDVDLAALAEAAAPPTTARPTTTSSPLTGPGTDFTVPFDAGSGVLNSAGRAVIEEAAEAIKALPRGSEVTVTGVTDNLGPSGTNNYLAGLRASSVIAALKEAGATNVTYLIERVQEVPTGDPSASRRADIDLA